MRCKKCHLTNEVDEKELLLDNIENNCIFCNEIKEKINSYCELGYIIYEKDIENWLYLNTPVFYEGHMLIGNSKKFDFPRASGEGKVREICQQNNIYNIILISKEEKKDTLCKILEALYDDLFGLIDINSDAVLLGLLTCVELNRYFSSILISGLMNQFSGNEPENSKLGKMVIQTFSMLLHLKKISEENDIKASFDFNEIYCKFESQIAFDKQCFEYGIEATIHRASKNKKTYNKSKFNSGVFFEIICLLRAIMLIRTTLIEYTEGYYKEYNLVIQNGEVINEDIFKGYEDNYIENMTAQQHDFFDEYKDRFNEILYVTKGFKIDTLQKILSSLEDNYLVMDEILIGESETWIQTFMKFGTCDLNEATAIFNEFVFCPDDDLIYSIKSRKENRIMRKSIIKSDNLYFSIVHLMSFSIYLFIVAIMSGDFNDQKFISKFQDLYKEINDKFEYEICNMLKEKLHTNKVKCKIGQKCIKVDGITLEIPGEIDVMAIYNNTIFIIECKNFDLKIETKSMANEYSKLTKENNDSFQTKLENKIKVIKENKNMVARFLGEENPDNISTEPIGVFVTNMFSFATLANDTKYKIVTKNELVGWITNH